MGIVALRSYPKLPHCAFAATLVVRETAPKPRLLDRVRQAIEARHYSRRTEKAYVHWIKRYIFFHVKHGRMGAAEINKPATFHDLPSLVCHPAAKVARLRTVQIAGHQALSMTFYTHVLNRGPAGVRSPADRVLP